MKRKKITAFITSLLVTANLMGTAVPLGVIAQDNDPNETTLNFSAEPLKVQNSAPELPTPSKGSATDACGETTNWTYDPSTKIMYLQGEGAVTDFYMNSEAFSDYAAEAETLIIESGITAIKTDSLNELANMTAVVIPRIAVDPASDESKAKLNDWFGGANMKTQLKSVTIMDGTAVPESYFYDLPELETVVLAGGIETIGAKAFKSCNGLKEITMPDGLKTICSAAFNGCSALTELTFNEGLETIEEHAFNSCSAVTSLDLPNSLKYVGYMAFYGMNELKDLVIPPNVEHLDSNLIYTGATLESITLPFAVNPDDEKGESSSLSLASFIGSKCTDTLKKVTITGGTIIPSGFMYGFSGVTEVNLPNSIEIIGKNAFYGCSGLTELNLPSNLEIIREGAFRGCSGITSLTLPQNIKRIEYTAFFGMNEVEEFTVPQSAEYIGTDLFGNDSKIQSVTLPFAGETPESTEATDYSLIYTIGFSSYNSAIPLHSVTLTGGSAIPQNYFKYLYGLDSVTFPDTLTAIGKNAFFTKSDAFNTSLESLVLPDSVISIGDYAFRNLSALSNITFSNNLREVGYNAFQDTAWLNAQTKKGFIKAGKTVIGYNGEQPETLNIPAGTIGIGCNAFQNGTFTGLSLPDGLLYIGRYSFDRCNSLTEVNIPETVEEIDNNAFAYCSSLETVNIPSTVSTVGKDVFSGSSWMNTLEEGPIYIGTKFYGYKGEVPPHAVIEIREGTDTIVDGALQNCTDLDEIILPESLKNIGNNAFKGCTSLTNVDIPDSVTNIGNYAFEGCTQLEEIALSADLETIGEYAFKNCGRLSMADMPCGVKSIGYGAFYNCGELRNIVIPDTIESLGSSPFGFDKNYEKDPDFTRTLYIAEGSEKVNRLMTRELTSQVSEVVIPEGVAAICEGAFQGFSNVTEIALPSTVTDIEKGAFKNLEGLTSVGEGFTLSSVGEEAFYNTGITATPAFDPDCTLAKSAFHWCGSLKDVTLPENISTIPREVFSQCRSISELVIPNNVTQIDYNAFHNNISLKTITIPNQLEDEFAMSGVFVAKDTINSGFTYDKDMIDGDYLPRTIIFADGRKSISRTIMNEFYKDAVQVVLPEGVETIGKEAFKYCEHLDSIEINDGLKEIGESAFATLTGLTEINLPEGLTTIGAGAFESCTGIKEITMPDTVTSAGDNAFNGCTKLRSIKLSEGLTELNKQLCIFCSNLKSISIPASIAKIGDRAFGDCYRLKTIEASDNVKQIASNAFAMDSYSVTTRTLIIRDGVENLSRTLITPLRDNYLAEVVLPESVKAIPNNAFDGCTTLSKINIPENLEKLGTAVFRGTKIRNITLPDTVTKLYPSMFENCTALETVKFSEEITEIPELAFSGCTSLSKVDTARESYKFKHNSSFKECPSLYDDRFSCLDKGSLNFAASKTEIEKNGFINLSVKYAFNRGVADDSTSKVVIALPAGVEPYEDSLNEGEYNKSNNTITLNNTGNTVVRTFTVKFTGDAETYKLSAVLKAEMDGKPIEETIGTLDIAASGVSINVPETINSLSGVTVSGRSFPGSEVTIYADGEEVGTVKASRTTGKYTAVVTLPEKDEKTYSLTAKADGTETEPVSVTYSSDLPEIENITLRYVYFERHAYSKEGHYYKNMDLTDAFNKTGVTKPVTYDPRYPISFDIRVNKPYDIQTLMINSTKGGETYTMVANWIPDERVYRAEGYFNPANLNYVMGELSIEVLKADPIMFDTSTKKFYGSADAIETFSQSTENEFDYMGTIGEAIKTEDFNAEDIYRDDNMAVAEITNPDGVALDAMDFDPDYFYFGDRKVTFDEAAEDPNAYGFARTSYYIYDSETNTMYEQYTRVTGGYELALLYNDYAEAADIPEEERLKYAYFLDKNGLGEVSFNVAIHAGKNDDNDDHLLKNNITIGADEQGGAAKAGHETPVPAEMIYNPSEGALTAAKIVEHTQQINENNDFIQYAENEILKAKMNTYTSDDYKTNNNHVKALTKEDMTWKALGDKAVEYTKNMLNPVKRANDWANKAGQYYMDTIQDYYDIHHEWWGHTVQAVKMSQLDSELSTYMYGEYSGANLGATTNLILSPIAQAVATAGTYPLMMLSTGNKVFSLAEKGALDTYVFDGAQQISSEAAKDLNAYVPSNLIKGAEKRLRELKDKNAKLQEEREKLRQKLKELNPDIDNFESLGKDVNPRAIFDPSGYVYEAVPENIISGATMTIYYKDPETGEEVVWDAEEYDQMNPLISDETGSYAWDVPEGLWRVKFELEGYETMYSDWMEVLPIRTNVNFAIVSLEEPELVSAVGADGKIVLTFSKYMDNETMTSKNIKVNSGKKEFAVKVTPASGNEQYADKYVIESANDTVLSGNLTVSLGEDCLSYSGTPMKAATAKIESPEDVVSLKVNSDQIMPSGTETEVEIEAFPASAVEGKNVIVTDASGQVVMTEQAVFDENGKAVVKVKLDKTGIADLTFGIEDSEFTQAVQIAVVEPESYEVFKDSLMYGDVNGDNVVNLKDAILIRRYITGGWGVQLDEKLADVGHDGSVNLRDVVMICRYTAGGWDVEF